MVINKKDSFNVQELNNLIWAADLKLCTPEQRDDANEIQNLRSSVRLEFNLSLEQLINEYRKSLINA